MWLPIRIAAAALALMFVGQGAGDLLFGSWVARHLHAALDRHLLFEAGVVLIALGAVLLAGAVARRWLDLAVVAGTPVGLAFAIHGWPELSEFPAGGVLHLAQGVVAVTLVLLWWHARRYGLARLAKREHGG